MVLCVIQQDLIVYPIPLLNFSDFLITLICIWLSCVSYLPQSQSPPVWSL